MKLKITVHGVAYEVEVEVLDAGNGFPAMGHSPLPKVPVQHHHQQRTDAPMPPAPEALPNALPPGGSPGGAVTSPIAGNVVEVKCKAGDSVEKGRELVIMEAMKMEASITAPTAGKIKSVDVAVGDAVREGQVVIQFQ